MHEIWYPPQTEFCNEGAKLFANRTDAIKRRGAETFVPGLKEFALIRKGVGDYLTEKLIREVDETVLILNRRHR